MSNGQPAVRVEGLWKTYQVRPIGAEARRARRRAEPFHALKDVTFELPVGSVLGILGVNGAGKSTLLKVLSQITDPTRGRAFIRGRVASLLEVGTGFHGALTGRENVFLNAAIHGLGRGEVRKRLDSILEFAGVGDFVDVPVKRYSSGMYLRLAFSVAAHLDPDLFIVDELLAVGDSAFRQKCLDTMSRAAHDGKTVILVSHELGAVQALCTQAIRLHAGALVDQGATRDVVDRYLRDVRRNRGQVHYDSGALALIDAAGSYHPEGSSGAHVHATLVLNVRQDIANLAIDFALEGPGGPRLLQTAATAGYGPSLSARSGETIEVDVTVEVPRLPPGSYTAVVYAQIVRDEAVLHVSGIPLFEVPADARHPETLLPTFRAAMLPRHEVRVGVKR